VSIGSRLRTSGRSALARVPRPRLPHGPRDAVAQVGLFLGADLLYESVRGLVVGHADAALAHARDIVSLERSLGVFVEPSLQHPVLAHHWLVVASNWGYLNVQFTMNAAFLAWLYVARNDVYAFVRNMFFVAMGLALTVHLLVPVAPPRMLPGDGFVDTVQSVAHINQDSGAIGAMVNPYAAVPSMHMCFALLVGLSGATLARRRWAKALWLAYPVVVLGLIVVTANHFFFDAAAGAVTAVAAALVAQHVMARARPARWAWARA
jgi:hypothetical protein